MALSTKTIKRRIRSVGNTKKITKAMEMISAVKMRKAISNALATRSYASLAWEMLIDVAQKTDINLHQLLQKRPVKKIGMLFITSNRGLAGGFTDRLLREAHHYVVNAEKSGSRVDIIVMGKKGRKIYKYFGHLIAAEFEKTDLTTKIEEILPIAMMVTAEYIEQKYDKVVIAYTDFVSAVKQAPRIKQILPLEKEDEMLREVNGLTPPHPPLERGGNGQAILVPPPFKEGVRGGQLNEFLFEPDPKQVLDMLLPRLMEMQVYQAILESDASEHSARMMAMRNASDAAEDMIKELNLSFNKARQASITREISEIVGGAAALE